MHTTLLRRLLLACILITAVIAYVSYPSDPPKIKWLDSLETALQQSKETYKPVLLVYSAEWCIPCKQYESATLSDPDVVELVQKSYIPVHLDYDDDPKAAQEIGASLLPWSGILDHKGKVLRSVRGVQKPAVLLKLLKENLETYNEIVWPL